MANRAMPTGDAAETKLKQIRLRYEYASDVWRKIRENGDKNMRFIAGDPWEPAERKLREDAGRPCLALDEITQHTNQVVNDLRAKRIGVKFEPVGNGANDNTAEFYANKWREVEYRSKAQIVYTTAVQNAIERGYGFARVTTKYLTAPGQRFNQELWLEEFPNPNIVLPDPDAKRPTHADMRYCFVHETYKKAEYLAKWPKAEITDFSGETAVLARRWLQGDDITVAEYWEVNVRERELVLLKGPSGATMEVFVDELKDITASWEPLVIKRRMEPDPYVCMYITNGVELLEKTDWPGKYIPIVACVGKVIYLDRGEGMEKLFMAMTDLMRDPQMLNAYLRTCEAELVGMTPKTPFVGYVGQFRGQETQWQKANHEPVPYLQAQATTEETGPQILPLPQRQQYDPPIQALEILAESSRRSIQAAAGSMPLPTAAQRRSEKSGVALEEMRKSAAVGSFHFGDHYNDFIEHIGVVGEDLMDKVLDSAREVPIRHANETTETVRINDPADPKSVPTKGDHLVTVSTGPSFDSERDAASDLADTIMGMGDPEYVRAMMPMAIKLKNLGAQGDELIEIAEALQPPQVQALKQKDGEQPTPEQMQAQLAQMTQQIQLAEQAMAELQKEAEGKQLDAQTKREVAVINAKTDVEVERVRAEAAREKADMDADRELALQVMKNAATIAVAHIQAASKGAAIDAHAVEEAAALGEAEVQAEAERAHQAGLAGAQAEQTVDEGQRARDHAERLAGLQAAQDEAGA